MRNLKFMLMNIFNKLEYNYNNKMIIKILMIILVILLILNKLKNHL